MHNAETKWLKIEKPNLLIIYHHVSCSPSQKKIFLADFICFLFLLFKVLKLRLHSEMERYCTIHVTTDRRPFEHIWDKSHHVVGSYQTLPSAGTVQFTRSGWPAFHKCLSPNTQDHHWLIFNRGLCSTVWVPETLLDTCSPASTPTFDLLCHQVWFFVLIDE